MQHLDQTSDIINSYHILLVEENPKELELYSDLIRGVAQCKIDVMSRSPDFLDWIGKSNYHLIIASEAVNGLSLLEHVKRLSPATSVILVSSTATVEKAVAAIRLGAEDYLSKPFNLDAFQLAVKRGLDKKVIFSENSPAHGLLNLLNSCQLISASLEQNKIFEIIQSYFMRELNAGYSAIYMKRDERLVRIRGVDPQETQDRTLEEILSIAIHAANPIHGMTENSESYRFIDRNQLVPSIFTFKFHCAGESDYYCICLNPEKPNSVDVFESQLRMLRAQIEVTGKNIEHYKGVQQLVYVDDVTGLYNTRYLNQTLEREIAQANNSEKSFAVLFIDADRFKAVNDLYGHINGSKLLNELGNQLKRYVREKDAVFRYGGDEFLAVLSPCDLNTAKTAAERIRESVEKTDFLKNDNLNIKITVSIGIALFPDHASTKKEIIEAADHAMYDAKKKSRNCVFVTKTDKEIGKKRKNYGR